jgi:hypothetical protein
VGIKTHNSETIEMKACGLRKLIESFAITHIKHCTTKYEKQVLMLAKEQILLCGARSSWS